MAVDANVDRGYISGIENATFNPTVDVLDRFAKALSVDVSDFFAKPVTGSSEPMPLKPGRKAQT